MPHRVRFLAVEFDLIEPKFHFLDLRRVQIGPGVQMRRAFFRLGEMVT